MANLKQSLDYSNKIILAPMVRIGTLPMRLLALRYGADIVYGEEIIDKKMLQCSRIENKLLGTVDYIHADGTVVFRTCAEETPKLVFQMGTNDADRALKVAKILEKDVSGLDINMGCPKEFSIKGGMGAALLTQPDKIKSILTTLVNGLKIPVTCKIRILPKLEDTFTLVKLIENAGVKAIGVHGRWKEERSSQPCHTDFIKSIREYVSIPVIANGGSLKIDKYNDILDFKKETGCCSVMLARAAQWNPSVFRKDGPLPVVDVMKDYLKIAIQYDSVVSNIKYVLCKMIGDTAGNELGQKIQHAADDEDLCAALGLEEYRKQILEERRLLDKKLKENSGELSSPPMKRFKENGVIDEQIIMDVAFNRKLYPNTVSPIQIVHEYCTKKQILKPVFNTITNEDRLFKSEMKISGKTYTTKLFHKRKKSAEQGAAIVFLLYHNLSDGRLKT